MSSEKIKTLYTTGRDVETESGDIISKYDITPDMEYDDVYPDESPLVDTAEMIRRFDEAAAQARNGLARSRRSHRGGKANPELSSQDLGRIVDAHIMAREQALGRDLTDQEYQTESTFATREALGIY